MTNTCADCGTKGNVAYDSDGIPRCNPCSYAAFNDRPRPPRETINGCPVIWQQDGYSIIGHPAGFMLYKGWRVGIYATLANAQRGAERHAAKVKASA